MQNHHANPPETQQPNTTCTDVCDPAAAAMPQAQTSFQMDTSVNSSTHLIDGILRCRVSPLSGVLFMSWLIAYILFLPVFIYVLYIGYKRWRKQRSVYVATVTNHSDVFTFHMVAVEMISMMGSCLYGWSMFKEKRHVAMMAGGMMSMTWCGQMCFHILTCLERYLAVVHPITYRSLKQVGGVRIRNITIGCVWLLSFSWIGLKSVFVFCEKFDLLSGLLWSVTSLVFISVCSFSVVCVLIRPGPGEVGGDRKGFGQSKQRALYTMMAIIIVLVTRFLVLLIIYILFFVSSSSVYMSCVVKVSAHWFTLPSSLVLPLLFLHRAGKLPCCKGQK